MARKKKTENKAATINSSVNYAGQVSIEKVRANKVVKKTVIKNAGCIPLFKFLANCLTIATSDNAERIGLFNSKPQYLNCFYVADPAKSVTFDDQRVKSYMKQIGVSIKSNETAAADISKQDNAYVTVEIRFLLQASNFKPESVNRPINVLALCGSSNVNKLNSGELPHAYIVITNPKDYITRKEDDDDVNYILTWTLKLANATK